MGSDDRQGEGRNSLPAAGGPEPVTDIDPYLIPDRRHSYVAVVPADWWDYGDESVAWRLSRELRPSEIVLEFVVNGDPASKARPRMATRNGSVRIYTPTATKNAEEVMAWRAKAALPKSWTVDAVGGFGVMAVFFSATWQRRDADNMLKLVCDALTGIVWKDDSQVSEVSAKVAAKGDPDPRTHVRVYRTSVSEPDHRPCERCGVAVRQYPSYRPRHCSQECLYASLRRTWACRTCGGESIAAAAQAAIRVYCSPECRAADPNRRKGNAGRPRTSHCRNGHERTAENTYSYLKADGREDRRCRACNTDRAREQRVQRRLA